MSGACASAARGCRAESSMQEDDRDMCENRYLGF